MSHTNSTTYYNLPQFLSSDIPTWLGDVNSGYADIDSALHTQKELIDTNTSNITNLSATVGSQATTINNLSNKTDANATNIATLENTFNLTTYPTALAASSSSGNITFSANEISAKLLELPNNHKILSIYGLITPVITTTSFTGLPAICSDIQFVNSSQIFSNFSFSGRIGFFGMCILRSNDYAYALEGAVTNNILTISPVTSDATTISNTYLSIRVSCILIN